MTKLLLSGLMIAVSFACKAQSLEKMQWFNEPEQWEVKNNSLLMNVTPQTEVKISGDYRTRFDQSGLMLRIDHENYIKAGIEFVDGKYNLSTVVTHHTSDWSIIPLDNPVPFVWIKAVRRLDSVEIFYSFDDKEYTMMRNAWLQDNRPVMVGIMGACPDGNGFKAKFEDFSIKHLPDSRRVQWLEENSMQNNQP